MCCLDILLLSRLRPFFRVFTKSGYFVVLERRNDGINEKFRNIGFRIIILKYVIYTAFNNLPITCPLPELGFTGFFDLLISTYNLYGHYAVLRSLEQQLFTMNSPNNNLELPLSDPPN